VKERTDPRKLIWVAIWAVAITVTLIGGSSEGVIWKADIQLPGSFLVFLFGWFIGPFQTIMNPLVVSVLTILTNVLAYYALVKLILFFGRKLRATR
jgi:choline-glycine betaine transporter